MTERANILIVDDNESLCKSFSFILKRIGFTVSTAEGGLEAIKKVKKSPFDVIFMDIKMPKLNGVEAFKKIKKIVPKAMVIMMTAYSVEALVKEALKEGAYEIIYKPLDMDNVLRLIENRKNWRPEEN